MTKRLSIASALLTAFSALMALLLLSAPAFAHHNDGHDKGRASSTSDGSDHDGDAGNEDRAYTEADDGDADDATDPNVDEDDNAHPSGKDRSVENGGSGNQGKSESNPDDSKGPMRYEGELGDDKPAGPGGTDLSDQDGNNGCGNDDDFDDDNNGHCGKPEPTPTPEPTVLPDIEEPCPTDMTSPTHSCDTPEVPEIPEDDVLGDLITKGDVKSDTEVKADDVEAAAARPATQGAALPFTGANVVLILIVALGLLGVGAALLRTRRN